MKLLHFTKKPTLTKIPGKDKEDVTNMGNDEQKSYLEVDEILTLVGQIGKLQVFVLFLFSTIFIVPAYQALAMVFIATNPPWRCSMLVNNTECNHTVLYNVGDPGYESRCSMRRSSWIYTEKDTSSIISEFDLVCENDPWSYAASSGLFIGQIFGSICIGWMSDKFGRKKMLLPSLFFVMTFSWLLSFAPNVGMFIILRFIIGIFYGGIFVCLIVMSVELLGVKYRAFGGLIVWQSFTVVVCFLSLQSYYIKNWRTLLLVVSIPYYVILPFGVKFIPESIRWQRSRNKLEEAEKTLRRIAASNNKTYPENCKLSPVAVTSTGSYKDLVGSLASALTTIRFALLWFCNDFIYFGISLSVNDLGGDLHRDFVLISLCEFPANLFSIYLLGKIGRRKSALLGYFVTAALMFAIATMQACNIKAPSIFVVLCMLGKISALISWSACSVWSSETYPTYIRSKAIGLFSVFSQLGAASSPWLSLWIKKFYLPLPFVIFGVFEVLGALAAFHLSETNNKNIKDVVNASETRNVDEGVVEENHEINFLIKSQTA